MVFRFFQAERREKNRRRKNVLKKSEKKSRCLTGKQNPVCSGSFSWIYSGGDENCMGRSEKGE